MGRKKKVPTDEQTIKKEQETNTGIMIAAGEIKTNDFDNISWTDLQADYYKIRNSDPLASSTVDILKYPILMSEYRIETPNNEISDYVYWVIDNMKKGFGYYKHHKLLAIDYGLSMHEMIVKYGDKYNGKTTNRPIWFNPIQNETIQRFYYDDFTDFIGIQHAKRTPEKGQTLINIDKENLDYFTYGEEFNDIRGRSIFRTIRFFWDCKHKVLNAKTIATQRGTGIVGVYSKGQLSNADKVRMETLGRTLSNVQNGYFLLDEEKARIELLELKNQQDVIGLVDYFDRQMFYNTLTQFITSGIGQNGSRSSTGEHKASYELMASYVLQLLEDNIQKMIDKTMEMSFFKNITEEDWPLIKFNTIKSIDLAKTAQQISALAQSGFLNYTKDDEKFLRQIFGMPEVVIPEVIVNEPPKITEKLSKNKTRKLSQDLLDWETNHFELESANEHYETISDKAKNTIESFTHEFILEIYNQLKTNRNKDILISNRIINDATKTMLDLYNNGFERGVKDIKKEIAKLQKGTIALAKKPIQPNPNTGKTVEKNIKNFFFRIKNVIENKMEGVSDQYIENKGGLENFILGFETGFKGEKNNIVNDIENGYTEGRGATLLDLSDDINTYFYTAAMDRSLCDHCAPLDGLILTQEEIENAGLNIGKKTVNPDCLGRDNCRCQLMAYSLK